jgi:tetratricopeptide (TPR) repeat protein
VAALGLALIIGGLVMVKRSARGPDNEGVLADAQSLIERQQYGPALDVLNGPITGTIGVEGIDPVLRARFHALRGEAVFLGQRQLAPDAPSADDAAAYKNNTLALEEFAKARELDVGSITPRRLAFVAEALLDLRRDDDAERAIMELPDEVGDRRRSLLREAIDRWLDGPPAFHGRAFALMERLASDPGVPEEDRAWVMARRAGAMLDDGNTQAAIDLLLTEVQRLASMKGAAAGELLLLLGRAYIDAGQLAPAGQQLAQAEQSLPPGDARRGLVETMLARIAHSRGDIDEARDRFTSVVERFPGTDAQALALLGVAETESDLGRDEEALAAYSKVIDLLPKVRTPMGVSQTVVEASLGQRHQARSAADQHEAALSYAYLALRTFPAGQTSAAAHERIAQTHRAIASGLLGDAANEPDLASRLGSMDSQRVEKARTHFARAGEEFDAHARRAMIDNPVAASESLWSAADSFDRAGDQSRAIDLFTQFVQTHKSSDRVLAGKYRLARCFQAMNKYDSAVQLFEEILRDNAGSDEAYRSYVPLAQCYLLRSGDADSDKAERLLLSVMSGRVFRPDAPDFRRALVELGQMYLRIGRAPDAIARLREAVERYPDAPERVRWEFDLADAMRLSAQGLDKQLTDAMPVSDRQELMLLRRERLVEAQGLYDKVRAALETIDLDKLSKVQQLILRNAIFYRGDCAYDLGDYDTAIRLYDAAAQRYATDPASLVAMIQIVNCYAAQGKMREARTAHSRAQMRLRELPESSWQGAMTPMDRRHWERWLETSLRLEKAEKQAQAGQSPGAE